MIVSGLRSEILFLTEVDSGDLLQRRAVGAYLGLAVGDALGATVEYLTSREIRERYRVHRDMVGGGWLRLRKGQTTDDTEMSLVLGRSILGRGQVEASAAAEALSDWMGAKPVDIGHAVRRGIARFRQTGESVMPESESGAGDGACVRCLPVALATLGAEVDAIDQANRLQAHVTHNHPVSDAGTLCVIRMVQAALLGGGKPELKRLADALAEADQRFVYDRKRVDNPSGFIVDALRAVFQSLFATDGLEPALVDVVNRGGDADTTGAILGMIAGALYGPTAIPRRWLRHLDEDIRQQCLQQAHGLVRLSPLCSVKRGK